MAIRCLVFITAITLLIILRGISRGSARVQRLLAFPSRIYGRVLREKPEIPSNGRPSAMAMDRESRRQRARDFRRSARHALRWSTSLPSSSKQITGGQEAFLDLARIVTSRQGRGQGRAIDLAVALWTYRLYARPRTLADTCAELGLPAGSSAQTTTPAPADLANFLACLGATLDSIPGDTPQARVLGVLALAVHATATATTTGSGGLGLARDPTPFFCVSSSASWFGSVDDSPVFRLFAHGCDTKGMYGLALLVTKGEAVVAAWLDSMYRDIIGAFRDGRASPRDIDEAGQTLLHRLMEIFLYDGPWPKYFIDELRKVMLGLHRAGVPIGGEGGYGESALSAALMGYTNLPDIPALLAHRELCRLLADLDVHLSAGSAAISSYTAPYGQFALELHYCPELREVFGNGPVLNAYASRSMAQVAATQHLAASETANLFGHLPIHLACFWPAGLKHVLQTTDADELFSTVNMGCYAPGGGGGGGWGRSWKPINFAVFASRQLCPTETGCRAGCRCAEALQLLLATGQVMLTIDQVPPLWAMASQGARLALLDELARRRRQLRDLALASLPPAAIASEPGLTNNHAESESESESESLLDSRAEHVQALLAAHGVDVPAVLWPGDRPPYTVASLDHDGATAAHALALGFRDVACFTPVGDLPVHAADGFARAWEAAGSGGAGWPRGGRPWTYHAWLLDRGAVRLPTVLAEAAAAAAAAGVERHDWDARVGATVAHTEARLIGRFLQNTDRVYARQLAEPALLRVATAVFSEAGVRDSCRCRCLVPGSGGCSPLTVALKQMTHRGVTKWMASGQWCLALNRLVRCWRGLDADTVRGLSLQVVRFVTFEALQLEHTCCDDSLRAQFDYDPADYVGVDWNTVHERFYPDTRTVEKVWEDGKLRTAVLDSVMAELEPHWREFREGGGLLEFLGTRWEPVLSSAVERQREIEEGMIWRERPRGVLNWESLRVHDVRALCGPGPSTDRELVARIGVEVDEEKCDHHQPWLDDFGETV
ncbi:hypothetical protein B0T24DRAFT_694404 [Lasiosphaeria ovina]|uniref:Uncharacterized protein n=1 Tax=Lasiosphaeria ovina TaxID=92902 RepID=A0AAE0KM73_9PEZI|nr:hypothetical protein B0T24DRAFT_694404 [Lasiosphaeria ovina]